MSTRFKSKSVSTFGVAGLPSGYDGIPNNTSSDLTIPSVGIEDVDEALFNLFDKAISFNVMVSNKNKSELKKVPVIFAAAEKWAISKKFSTLRDKNGTLILPIITVVRTSIKQDMQSDIVGRGINQQTGELVVKRRLDASDRQYQNLINRMLIKNQTNVAVNNSENEENQFLTDRHIGDLSDDPTVTDGAIMAPNIKNNIFEVISVPSPQFFTVTYDVTFWAQYTVQLNQMLETTMISFLPQGNAWKLDTKKGYWFIGHVDGNDYSLETNADNMTSEERILKHKFSITVPAYVLASSIPGAPIPIKRYISSPEISFEILTPEEVTTSSVDDPFLGSDDPTLPLTPAATYRNDQRMTGKTRLYPNKNVNTPHDPAINARHNNDNRYKKMVITNKKGKKVTKYIRVTSVNRHSGETVYSSNFDLDGLSAAIIDD